MKMLLATVATVATAAMLTAGASCAQTWAQPGAYGWRAPAAVQRKSAPQDRTSYGVGYRGRTSATGGPVGGYPSRN